MEKISTFLRDPIWQFIGVIFALIVAWISWKQSQRKSLSFEVIDSVGILDVPKEFRERIEVKIDSRPINQMQLVIIKIVNSGNTSIRPGDYHRPISVEFGEKSEILSFEIVKQKPLDLGVTIDNAYPSSNVHRIRVEPVLLNRNDSFTIKILVSGFVRININGRIAGVESIREMIYLWNHPVYKHIFPITMVFCVVMYLPIVIYTVEFSASIYEFFILWFNDSLATLFSSFIPAFMTILLIKSSSFLVGFFFETKVHRR